METTEGFDATRMRSLVRLARPTVHEMRGASGAIAIHLELLGSTLDAIEDRGVRERLSRHLAVLQREHQRLLAMTDAFLMLVAAPGEHPADLDLSALVRETGEALRPLAVERRVRLDVVCPSYPIGLTAVREHVRQQLLDLALPLIDSATPGSPVSLHLTATADRATIALRPGAGRSIVLEMPRIPGE